ncbi:MAG TPA: DNA-directed RNA polymerase subunit D [archaeon]|nr:DNA-directed RNA polymerase subunit D [archaeon]HLD80486.1 DNA-directed RNA polymerase subunit D [archaeon]
MKIEVIKEASDRLLFVWHVTPRIANVFRRVAMNEVPTLAIEDLSIYENTSVFFDEYISHRLGLVPLKTDTKGMKLGDKEKFTLEKSGPCTVYSKDLKFKDPKTGPMYDEVPILKLNEGQRIRLEGEAEVNKGEEHAKWQPGLVTYQAYPRIEVLDKKKLKDADKEKASKAITNAVVSFDKNGNPEIKEPWKCALDGSERDASNGAFQFAPEKDKVIFQIESWGQVAPREILSKAAQGLMEVNEEFAKLAKKELS